jgi:hypothetical protein
MALNGQRKRKGLVSLERKKSQKIKKIKKKVKK